MNRLREVEKKGHKYGKEKDIECVSSSKLFADMHDFPFKSITDFLPGVMTNNVNE